MRASYVVAEHTALVTRAIDVALGLIAEDLDAGGVPLPRVDPAPWQPWEPSESVTLLAADGTGMGVWLDLGLSRAEGLAHLADQVQDWAGEELGRLGRPTNWPACAAHPTSHPLRPRVQDGRAVWACPVAPAVWVPIGGASRG